MLLIFTFLLSGYPALLSNEDFYDASACLLKRTKEFENIQHAIDLDQKYFKIQIKRDRSKNDKRVVHRVTTSDNEWQRVVQRVTTNGNEWYNKWQRMTTNGTTSDYEWQRVTKGQGVTANDSKW